MSKISSTPISSTQKTTNTKTTTQAAAEAPVKKSAKESGRSMEINAFGRKYDNMTYEDIIDYDPKIIRLKAQAAKLQSNMDEYLNKMNAIQTLQEEIYKDILQKSEDIKNYTALPVTERELKTVSIVSNDTGDAQDYISVDASSLAYSQKITISNWAIASSHNISIGTANSTEPLSVYNAIQAALSVNAAKTDALAAVGSNLSGDGLPLNPSSRILYGLCLAESYKTSPNLVTLKANATSIWSGMNQSLSDGFATKDTVIVGNGASLLPAGTYYLYSMPGGVSVPKALNTYITQANSVYQAINSIAALPNITQLDVTTAIAGISGLTYDVSGLPSNNDFAYLIANAAYTEAGALGAPAADVKAEALSAASLDNIKTYAKDFGEYKYGDNSPILANKGLTYLTQAIINAANTSSATIATVQTATSDALTAFKNNCSIVLTAGQTLSNVVDAINFISSYSGVSASAPSTGAGSYMLNIFSAASGLDYQMSILDSSDADVASTLFASVIKFDSPATNSVATVGNSTFAPLVTSNSNTIEYNGVYIKLLKVNTSASYSQTISIGDNVSIYKEKIHRFIDSINKLRIFVAEQTRVDPGDPEKYKDTTPLRLDSIITSVRPFLSIVNSYTVTYEDDGYISLPNIGITLDKVILEDQLEVDVLAIDEKKLEQATSSNFEQVRRIFEFRHTSSSRNLKISSSRGKYQNMILDVTIHIVGNLGPDNKQVRIKILNTSGTTLSTDYYSLSGSASNYKIDCNDATSDLYGLVFVFKNNVDENGISVVIKQGVVDYSWAEIKNFITSSETRLKSFIEDRLGYQNSIKTQQEMVLSQIDRVVQNASSTLTTLNSSRAESYILEQITKGSSQN
ncbi:MAG: flagellar filament capping protein FliD [Rickettsiaceae bacterium]|nr:flagellar filament capping protein FliD [Rickettsiaceae bacterium]